MTKKVCIVARQEILDFQTKKAHDDQGLFALDGIRYGKVHEVDLTENDRELMRRLIDEFEKDNPDFTAHSYELLTKEQEA